MTQQNDYAVALITKHASDIDRAQKLLNSGQEMQAMDILSTVYDEMRDIIDATNARMARLEVVK